MPGVGRRIRQQLLQTLVGSPAFAALYAGDPGDVAASGTEPTIGANGYARQSVSWSAVALPIAGAVAVLANSNTLTFTSTGVWNPTNAINFMVVFTTSSGNSESAFVGSCALVPARLVDRAGIAITIPAGALTLTIGLED